MHEFELPTNIRQIGGIDDRLRIYVEDYAISYLKRFAESGGSAERLAFLIGKYIVIDSQSFLFICGAVCAKHTKKEDGAETLTEQSFEHARTCLDKYFEGYEIVGWMQSQPGYGTRLNPVCGDYHMNNFIKPYHSLLVIDPAEKLESFYIWEKNMSEMTEARGYFIYFDRNAGMQEYIIDNKLTGIRDFASAKTDDAHGRLSGERGERDDKSFTERRFSSASRASSRDREQAQKQGGSEYKRLVNMMVSLSAVLFVICFIMGAGLIQADGKITQTERDVASLNAAFTYAVSQINQLTAHVQILSQQQARPVYAAQEAPLAESDDSAVITEEVMVVPVSQEPSPTPYPSPSPEPSPGPVPTNQQIFNQDPPPTPAPSPTPTPNRGPSDEQSLAELMAAFEFDTYTVRRGDTLSGIIYRFYGTMEMMELVMEINGITHPDMIFFGRVLLMPRIDGMADIEE